MSDKPKHRWYQFSLETLLAAMALVGLILGVALPWRTHRRFCLERAQFHQTLESLIETDVGTISLAIGDFVKNRDDFREFYTRFKGELEEECGVP